MEKEQFEVGIPVSDSEDVAMVKREERRREKRMRKRKLGVVVCMLVRTEKLTDSPNYAPTTYQPF